MNKTTLNGFKENSNFGRSRTEWCIYTVLRLQRSQFQDLLLFSFLLINQNLGASVYAPKSGYQSQKQPVLKPYISQIFPYSVLFC